MNWKCHGPVTLLLLRQSFCQECLCLCCLGKSPKHETVCGRAAVVRTACSLNQTFFEEPSALYSLGKSPKSRQIQSQVCRGWHEPKTCCLAVKCIQIILHQPWVEPGKTVARFPEVSMKPRFRVRTESCPCFFWVKYLRQKTTFCFVKKTIRAWREPCYISSRNANRPVANHVVFFENQQKPVQFWSYLCFFR